MGLLSRFIRESRAKYSVSWYSDYSLSWYYEYQMLIIFFQYTIERVMRQQYRPDTSKMEAPSWGGEHKRG